MNVPRVVGWAMLWVLSSSGYATGRASAEELGELLMPLIEAHEGSVAVCIRDLKSDRMFEHRADEVQSTASLIKTAVMVTAYRMADSGQTDLNRMLTLTEADKVPGSGILTDHFSAGMTLSLRDAIRLMIRYSDNTATNLVIDQIGLPTTTRTMTELGFPETRLNAKVYRRDTSISPDRSRKYGLGSTTALESVRLLEAVYRNTAASEESCRQMTEHLLACDNHAMISADLPAGSRVAQKTGSVNRVRTCAGIIFGPTTDIAVCILTADNKDQRWNDNNAAQVLMRSIARTAFDFFNPEWQRTVPEAETGVLAVGAFGERVEMLQRTLNVRSDPGPELSVDGDFGPATEAAVRRFQEARQLPVTGVADVAFWKALGPVVDEQPVAEPDIVNAEMLPKSPADPADGIPFVTADAWIVVDADNNRVLAEHESQVPRDFASTTKIMTAWLVFRLAQEHPEISEELVTMSPRADNTLGSTSAIRAGEQLTVKEALYGLMLPSGNDMSVALAEHFGHRLAAAAAAPDRHSSTGDDKPDSSEEAAAADPLPLFVDAMNREAARIGMTSTHYRNPHGLTSEGHVSTAADLALLARTVFADESFRAYVNTRQHGVQVGGPGGYRRNVLWKNTNQLLNIEGFDGIKTGTTEKAGACLVSTGNRNGRRLIVIVLGSAASEARYTDSRNLYRWGWERLLSP
ncbi:MAG: serine hydrolase [Planctomycetaceae bacterium]|nr:serine hydrolase [Planctomycetaceae bacterium]